MDRPIFITDIADRIVGGLKPARGTGEGWVAVPFRCAEFDGTGIAAGALSGAAPLAIELGLSGHHVLYVALTPGSALRVWLDGDNAYREFVCQHGASNFQECRMWRADLTGKRLNVAMKTGANPKHAGLGYLVAEPAPLPESRLKNLRGTFDGYSYLAIDGYDEPRDIRRLFTPLRDSDVGRILYGPLGADVSMWHPTKVGSTFPTETTNANALEQFIAVEATRRLEAQRADQLAIAVECARELGIEIQFYIRPEAFGTTFPYVGLFDSKWAMANPQWRCRDEFGDEILRMSYAYPEVQDHMLEYFEELLAYKPDGLCFAFNRSLPMMICEEPVLAEYERRHGRRPKLPEAIDSPELSKVRQDLLAGFLKRVHDQLAPRGMTMSCIVTGDDQSMKPFGFDLESCLAKKWFDEVYVAENCKGSAFWQRIASSGAARIYPNGSNWQPNHDQPALAKFTLENITGRYDGAFFWDIEQDGGNPYNWHLLRKLADVEWLAEFVSGTRKPPVLRPVTHINGVKCGRYHPTRSY
jgi:hypothetical protein